MIHPAAPRAPPQFAAAGNGGASVPVGWLGKEGSRWCVGERSSCWFCNV